ncbi:glycerophosphoryl diester phosphodiesterase membrane domain-containing protein [Qipengyuania sp. MTN3-11]|uniref:glycerophosphoryl diester phosphodiesterase membrane domain-containing protein n=1 Tax=Qipengyuania sp. MTN3-11 TaxID=3056557 RepID=UPI0036F427A8
MKLDLSAAWDGAIRMLTANREVLVVLGGVFFFLPYLATSLFLPEPETPTGGGGEPDFAAAMEAMQALYAEYWWVLLLLAVVQGIGLVAVLVVLGDASRPTVGQAIARGGKYLLPQIAAQLIIAAIMIGLMLLALAIGLAVSRAVASLLVIAFLPAMLYLVVKFSLAAPVIAIERTANPVAALRRSWRLTKGNSLRLLAFYLLLLVALVVLSMVLSLILGLAMALLGESAALIGSAVAMSLLNTLFALIAYAILASVHRQLSRSGASVPRTASE